MGNMARNTEQRHQKIFEDAIVAAKSIAEAEGLPGLTARRIAKRIGCSVGTLYNVFDNLDTLILHLNGKTFDALYDTFMKLETGGDVESRIRAEVWTYLNFISDNANLWSVIFEHSWPPNYPFPHWYLEKIQRLYVVIADTLAALMPDSEKEQSYQAAIALWGGLHGISSLAASGKLGIITSDTVNGLSEVLVRNFIAGLQVQRSDRAV